jgi:hypothetical protein
MFALWAILSIVLHAVPLSDTVIEELASQERLRVCGEQPSE